MPDLLDDVPDLMGDRGESNLFLPRQSSHPPSQHSNNYNLNNDTMMATTTGTPKFTPNQTTASYIPAMMNTHTIHSSSTLKPSSSTTSIKSSQQHHAATGPHNQSFLNSWSMQFAHHSIVPPITSVTIDREDSTEPYPTRQFTVDYAPFWWANLAHFVMFVAYSLVINLLTTVYGPEVSGLLAFLYIVFILSAIAMPPINMFVFNNNTIGTIFVGTIGYTFLMFTSIWGNYWFLAFGCVIAGSAGGLVWVGFSSVLSIMSRHFVEQDFLRDTKTRLHTRLKTDFDHPDQLKLQRNIDRVDQLTGQLCLSNGRVDLSKLSEEQTKRLIVSTAECIAWNTSISWIFLSASGVVGAIISYLVLSLGDQSDPVGSAQRLFVLFTFFGVASNLLYLRTWFTTSPQMFASNDQPLEINPDVDNDNIDIVNAINDEGDVIHTSKSSLSQQSLSHLQIKTATINNSNYNGISDKPRFVPSLEPIPSPVEDQTITPPTSSSETRIKIVNPSSSTIKPNRLTPYQPTAWESVLRSLYMMKNMLGQRVIVLSLWTWYQTLFPMSLAASFFTANAVKPTLGVSNVPIIIMTIYLTGAISAWAMSKVMKGFVAGRWAGIIGTCVEILFAALVLIFPHTDWVSPQDPGNLTRAWISAILIAAVGGIGDAIAQSGANTALGILVEGSVLLRSGGFGLSQVCKCFGSVTIFFTGRYITFKSQVIMIIVILIISLAVQCINFWFHKPIDVEYLVTKLDRFIAKQEAIGRLRQHDAEIATDLDDLGSQ